MRNSLQRHLRANAVAYLALFLALCGTSFAAASVITGKDVKNSSLTGRDVKDSSLTGFDVKNKTLTPADFIGSVKGERGETGRPGEKGDPGTNGTNASTHVVVRSNFADPTSPPYKVSVSCEPGEVATGGGAYASSGVVGSYPEGVQAGTTATGWTAYGLSPAPEGVYVYVMCASP